MVDCAELPANTYSTMLSTAGGVVAAAFAAPAQMFDATAAAAIACWRVSAFVGRPRVEAHVRMYACEHAQMCLCACWCEHMHVCTRECQ